MRHSHDATQMHRLLKQPLLILALALLMVTTLNRGWLFCPIMVSQDVVTNAQSSAKQAESSALPSEMPHCGGQTPSTMHPSDSHDLPAPHETSPPECCSEHVVCSMQSCFVSFACPSFFRFELATLDSSAITTEQASHDSPDLPSHFRPPIFS